MGICKVIIIKDIEFQCNLFIVSGNGLTLLGMPDCERLQLLGITCDTMPTDLHGRQINEQPQQIKKKKKKFKN